MNGGLDVSVVIGFRDWGLLRLELACQSIRQSFGDLSGEVIVSDYGSLNAREVKSVSESAGAKYVYTPRDSVWSRSRALNAGFAHASGRLLVSTDADMVFSSRSFERIFEIWQKTDPSALFLQCRDLPDGVDDVYVRDRGFDWDDFESLGRLRPRWGMGGMMAISRTGFERIRGFDERLHTYGGEDLDFAQRARRAGFRTVWVNDPDVRMFHMWHPSSAELASKSKAASDAVAFNRSVVYDDKTSVRNIQGWRFKHAGSQPLVSVAIVTKNRSSLLRESIDSVLAQSVQDFEIVVVDDGSEDETRSVVETYEDSRIRYFRSDGVGISRGRNMALENSKGIYTAVLDDDDLMHPRRLEWQLSCLSEGSQGSVGSFLNFDDVTGEVELIVSQLPTVATAAERGGAAGHGTWLIETEVMRRFKYDESIESGVDNNLMLRMLRSGVVLDHAAKVVILRRTHAMQVTQVDTTGQTSAASQSRRFFNYGLTTYARKLLSEERKTANYPTISNREDLVRESQMFLPDRLVQRSVVVCLPRADCNVDLNFDGRLSGYLVKRDGHIVAQRASVTNASYRDLVSLRRHGIDFSHYREDAAPIASAIEDIILDASNELTSAKSRNDAGATLLISKPNRHIFRAQERVYWVVDGGIETSFAVVTLGIGPGFSERDSIDMGNVWMELEFQKGEFV